MEEHTVMATLYEDTMGNLYWHNKRLSRFHSIGNGKDSDVGPLMLDAITLYRGDYSLPEAHNADIEEGLTISGTGFTPIAHVYEDGEVRIYAERMSEEAGYYAGFGPMLTSKYFHQSMKRRHLEEEEEQADDQQETEGEGETES